MVSYWTLLRWIHVMGAIIWLGGVFFVVFMLRPAMAQIADEAARRTVLAGAVARMRTFMNLVVPIQVLTGALLAWPRITLSNPWWEAGWALFAKILLATIMVSLYFVVPRLLLSQPQQQSAASCCERGPGKVRRPSTQQKLGHLLHLVMLTLGFAIVFVAKIML
ncbi:MAG: DUF2269 family protein [Bacillota bacterium]